MEAQLVYIHLYSVIFSYRFGYSEWEWEHAGMASVKQEAIGSLFVTSHDLKKTETQSVIDEMQQ